MAKTNSQGAKIAEIAGLATGLVTVAAAGAYFLYGSKNAKKYRSVVRSWMFKAKAEILEQIEKLEHISEEEYNTIVDAVLAKYTSVKDVHGDDVKKFVEDLKKQWKLIKREIAPKKKTTKKSSTKKGKK